MADHGKPETRPVAAERCKQRLTGFFYVFYSATSVAYLDRKSVV